MKLIKQGEQEGRRCAVIGLYTDRMAMSVMQRGEQGSFCLYRRQWEGELLDQQGELDVERLAGVADSFAGWPRSCAARKFTSVDMAFCATGRGCGRSWSRSWDARCRWCRGCSRRGLQASGFSVVRVRAGALQGYTAGT